MKNLRSKKNDFQIEYNRNFYDGNKIIKTTNINILLNRVRKENKSNLQKKIILSTSIIGIVFFVAILAF